MSEPLIVVLGVGGIGCPAALAVARRGSVRLRLVDADRVDVSNLHRQILFRTADAGRLKVDAARERLEHEFPGVQVHSVARRADAETLPDLLQGAAVVIDGTDNFPTRFAANDVCVATGTPLVHAAVLGMSGQLMTVRAGSGCYRCVFETPPPPGSVPTCARAGVVGPVAGVIGALAADEAWRIATGQTPLHLNRLLTFDGRSAEFRAVRFRTNPDCEACAAAPGQRFEEQRTCL